MSFSDNVTTNLTMGVYEIVKAFDLGIEPYLIFPENWESLIVPEPEEAGDPPAKYLALVYQLDDDRFIEPDQIVVQVDVYGDGLNDTLTKSFQLLDHMVWDPHGSSYHFFPGGMFDDTGVRGRPSPVPTDQDRVSLVTNRYTLTIRV